MKDAVRRNRRDLEIYKASGSFVFNADEGGRVCRFIEELTHVKGALSGNIYENAFVSVASMTYVHRIVLFYVHERNLPSKCFLRP